MAIDVNEAQFEQAVIERSRRVPVVVDFWAAWCGPCRTLGPALESAVAARDGAIELAKVDVDQNQGIAGSYRIQGIPAVKAFKGGEVVSEFTGAIPPAQIESFLDALVPSEADRLAAAGDEASLRKALDSDPRHAEAARKLGRILLDRGENDEAAEMLEPFEGDFLTAGLGARARLAAERDGASADALATAFAAWDDGDHAAALEALQDAVAEAEDSETKDLLRKVMVAIFTELGPQSELARDHRRRLAAALV